MPTRRRSRRAHLAHVGLPGRIAEIPGSLPTPEDLLQLMAQDKKVKGGKLTLMLVRGIGEAFVERDVAMARLSAFLKRECAPSCSSRPLECSAARAR